MTAQRTSFLGNGVAAEEGAGADALDGALRTVDAEEDQMDFPAARLGFAHEAEEEAAGEGVFDHEAEGGVEIRRGAAQRFPAGCAGCGVRIRGVQFAGDSVGMEQALAAFEINASGESGFAGAVLASDYGEGGHDVRRRAL